MINNSKKNKKLCDDCDDCCHYVAIEIDKPEDKEDWEHIKWYLLHKNVNVFIDWEDDWFVEFVTSCTALDAKTKLCIIYKNRPQVCCDYSQKTCTQYNNEPAEKKYFKTINDLEKYLKQKIKK